MADDKGRSRRSFLGDLLTGAAGGWVALTSTSAVSAFLAACSGKKGDSAKKDTPGPKPVETKYGGPVEPMDMDRPVMVKYGGPAVEPPPPRPMDMEPAMRPTSPMRTPPVKPRPRPRPKKYGGRRTKYGGRFNRPKYGGRPSWQGPGKYGGIRIKPKKYGGNSPGGLE